jgi:hypothetical protein
MRHFFGFVKEPFSPEVRVDELYHMKFSPLYYLEYLSFCLAFLYKGFVVVQ